MVNHSDHSRKAFRFNTLGLPKFLIAGLYFQLLSCASYVDHTSSMRESVVGGAYTEALENLEGSPIATQQRNRLLYLLEKAVILDRLGQKKRSRKALLEADKLGDELYTVSISSEAASYVVNDSVTDYAGEDYERVAIHKMLAISFLESGELDAARVEARRINRRLKEIVDKHGDDYSAYRADAFALFLSGLIYEALGEWDSAIIDYKKSLETYEKGFFGVAVPDSLLKSFYHAAKARDRTDLIDKLKNDYPETEFATDEVTKSPIKKDSSSVVFIGLGEPVVRKRSDSFVLSTNSGVYRYSWPVIPQRYTPQPLFDLKLSARQIELEFASDVNEIARKTLENNRLRMTVKNVARLIAKAKLADEIGQRGGPLAGLLANVVNAVTETADTRSWTLLPGGFHIRRIWTAEGISLNGSPLELKAPKVPFGASTKRSKISFHVLKE